MTDIVLVRHGQSANNSQPEHLRVCDPGLTAIGAEQAAQFASAVAEWPITHLYCSPFLRALETVRPVAEVKQLPVSVRPDIFEQGGCYSGWRVGEKVGEPGMGFGELTKRYPGWHIDDSIPDTGWWGRDYETLVDATLRAQSVAAWLLDSVAPEGGLHVFVIHADFKFLLLEALHDYARQTLQLANPLYNAGVSRARIANGELEFGTLNCVQHLDTVLHTC